MVSSHDSLKLVVKLRASLPVEEPDIRRTLASPANVASEPELAELLAGHATGCEILTDWFLQDLHP